MVGLFNAFRTFVLGNEKVQIAGVFAATIILGVSVATAAIQASPEAAVKRASLAAQSFKGLSARPLSSGRAVVLTHAFGEDDEDCVYVAASSSRPSGKARSSVKLVCSQ